MRIHPLHVLALATAFAGAPAFAQDHSHHAHPAPQTPPPKSQPAPKHDHAAMHGTPSADADAHAHDDHRQMDHSGMDHSKMDHSKMDHAAMGHATPVDHAQHAHHAPQPAAATQAPREPIPAITDADRRAAFPDLPGHPAHDLKVVSFLQFDRLEAWDAHHGTGMGWETLGWLGNDEHRLWLRSEGERENGHLEEADVELFYGRPVAPWWDLLVGVRHDFGHASQTFAGIGVVGLAPYKFEVAATAYVGDSGQTAATLEAEYETLFTNRLILQSVVEAEFYGRDDERRRIGSGLGTVEAGLRLRYEFNRRFAPYVGVVHERAFGRTADLRAADGEDRRETRVVAGVRVWF